MVRLTQQLVKRKTDHHDGLLEDLEEISLHQLNIEKIEVIQHICKKLKILLLQNNLIGKIENVYKLKRLEYLNLAINNLTELEGLDQCEKLQKLDLTVNFIDCDMLEKSLRHLQPLEFLRELYLTGNPCTDFPDYRATTIGLLPQLTKLDGTAVLKSEILEANQTLAANLLKLRVVAAERAAVKERNREEMEDEDRKEKERAEWEAKEIDALFEEDQDEEMRETRRKHRENERLARKESNGRYTPEMRLEMYREQAAKEKDQEDARNGKSKGDSKFAPAPDLLKQAHEKMNKKVVPPVDGSRPPQRNGGKYEYSIEEDQDNDAVVVKVGVPRFLDTSDIDVDVHPTWLQVIVKEKNILLHLPEEVLAEKAKLQRLVSNGYLIITLPVCESDLNKRPKYRLRNLGLHNDGAVEEADGHGKGGKGGKENRREFASAANAQAPMSSSSSSSSLSSSSSPGSSSAGLEAGPPVKGGGGRDEASKGSIISNVSSIDASGLVQVKVKVSKKLEREREKKEQEEQALRYQRLQEEQERVERERRRKLEEKAKKDKDLSALALELGINPDDVPPLE